MTDPDDQEAGRPRPWVAGLRSFPAVVTVVVVLLVVAGGAALLLRDDTYRASTPPTAAEGPRPAAAAAALHDLVGAVERGASAEAATSRHAGVVLANAADLHVRDFTARYVDEVGATEADGSWTAAVEMSWRFAGFDEQSASTEVLVTFARDGADVTVESIGGGQSDGQRRSPLWLRERLAVVRTPQALVLVAGGGAEAAEHAGRVARGLPVVRRVLTDWQPSVVVEVPGSAAELDETLGADPGTYAGIAAVTTSVDGDDSSSSPVHVFVNPEVTDRLQGRGAQVVMSHELVHVATDAATSSVDLWLLEGFADYVALRDVPLPVEDAAARAIALVERRGVPDRLPGTEEFDTRADDLEAAYELAWLACREVADAAGEDALAAAYRAAQGGTPVGEALRRHTGLTTAELVSRWQGRLQDLAS